MGGRTSARRIQITVDCADPDLLCAFWSRVLGYQIQGPPQGFENWTEYWLEQGIPADELGHDIGNDRISDPAGVGPAFWFQQVPEPKTVKNRIHLDISASGGAPMPLPVRRQRVDAEVERLLGLGASRNRVLSVDGVDHYGVVMQDPEGNEFCVH